jgi:cobalt-zinc-cadmium efflux system outer membrane protein
MYSDIRRVQAKNHPTSCGLRIANAWLLLGASLFSSLAPAQAQQSISRVDLDQAIELALAHNHALKAVRTQIQQSQAEEITAGLRPNPVFTADYSFLPIFSPSTFDIPVSQNPLPQEFDAGLSYTIERGHKRQARLRAARDLTSLTRSQVSDTERGLVFRVAQQFVAALLAKSNLEFARKDLESFQQTVSLSESRYKAGDISEGDLLKIRIQLLQFQTDVSSAELALAQSLASLRQLLGYDAVPADYDVIGDLTYTPLRRNKEDLQALALRLRPDLQAAQQGVTAAESQFLLAKANAKRDLTTSLQFNHVSGVNAASFGLNIELPFFNRNQGEIARTRYAVSQSQETRSAVEEAVLTDVASAYEAVKSIEKVVQLYAAGALKHAQDSRDISEFAYQQGAASLLDYLDAERSYRATQLAYRQALANYMLAAEQLREAVGTRTLNH